MVAKVGVAKCVHESGHISHQIFAGTHSNDHFNMFVLCYLKLLGDYTIKMNKRYQPSQVIFQYGVLKFLHPQYTLPIIYFASYR